MNSIVLSRRSRVGKRTKKRGLVAESIWRSRLYDAVWRAVTESIVYDRPSAANCDVSKVVELLNQVSDFSEPTVVSVLREARIDDSPEILGQIAASLAEDLAASAEHRSRPEP